MTDVLSMDHYKLRTMTIGELLDRFEPQFDTSGTGYLEPAVNALVPILDQIAGAYDDMDVRECEWALSVAALTVEASIKETIDKRTAVASRPHR